METVGSDWIVTMGKGLSTAAATQGLAVVVTIITLGSALWGAMRSVLILLEGLKGRNDGRKGWTGKLGLTSLSLQGGESWRAGPCLIPAVFLVVHDG